MEIKETNFSVFNEVANLNCFGHFEIKFSLYDDVMMSEIAVVSTYPIYVTYTIQVPYVM